MNQQNIERGWKLRSKALARGLVMIAFTVDLCSCGVYQIADSMAHPDDDDKGLTAAMDIWCPPLLIIGDWPSNTGASNVRTTSDYMEIIRTRNDGRMSPERSIEILDAMDRVFPHAAINDEAARRIEKLMGPPDKTIVHSGKDIDVYQVHTPSGVRARWLVRGA